MAKELTTKQKQEWAQLLYLQNQFTQKAISDKVGVSENTISKWVREGNWDSLRKSLLTTKTEILKRLYNHLDKISQKMEGADEPDAKAADAFVKYTAAINNLETETSIGQIMEVGRMFVSWLQVLDPKFALDVLNHFDAFIKEKLKKY